MLRYTNTYGMMHELLAMISVVQLERVAKNPCGTAYRLDYPSRLRVRGPTTK